jgi:hypothetical protein
VADIIKKEEEEEDPLAVIKSENEVSLCPCVHAASPPYYRISIFYSVQTR